LTLNPRAAQSKTNLMGRQSLPRFLPEKAEQSKDGKKELPEEHDLPQVVEVKQLANASQGLKDKNSKKGFQMEIVQSCSKNSQ